MENLPESASKGNKRRRFKHSDAGNTSSLEDDLTFTTDTLIALRIRELESLWSDKVLRLFKLNTGQDDHAVMFLDDYLKQSKKVNLKESNPYLKNDGVKVGANQLLSSSIVGEAGASWRLKALRRAQEQAARKGRSFQEVVGERWGSLGESTASAASQAAAPTRAHLLAIKSRQRGATEENSPDSDKPIRRDSKRDYIKNASLRHHEMKAPKVRDSLSWGKRKSQFFEAEGAEVISAAASSLNKFSNDGSSVCEFVSKKSDDSDCSVLESFEAEKVPSDGNTPGERIAVVKNEMSANQLAAKAMQLRLKGKNEEADKLMQEAKVVNTKLGNQDHTIRSRAEGSSGRYAMQKISTEKKKAEDDADMHLPCNIMQNKQFKVSTQACDEYDYGYGQSRKSRKKQGGYDHKNNPKKLTTNRFLTQQERCLFCLENPNRPIHLVVSIADFPYLTLPQWQPVVPGHCCILPIQHESATRTVDDNVWVEIQNFRKCLIMMFAKQDKEMVFLETVMGLAQQRHCMVKGTPLPRDIAKEAPLYFKKAIDDSEDEWSQH